MRNILFLMLMLLIYSCGLPAKTGETVCVRKTAPDGDSTEVSIDTVISVYSAEDEARIKKDSLRRVRNVFPFILKYSFEHCKAAEFPGEPAAPDFRGNPFANDHMYVKFITEGCRRGINFGGHYTLIEKGCGMMCEHLFIVDRRNGKIYTGSFGLKEEDGYYGFTYTKDSNLLIANATSLIDASLDQLDEFSIKPEVFKLEDGGFVRLE